MSPGERDSGGRRPGGIHPCTALSRRRIGAPMTASGARAPAWQPALAAAGISRARTAAGRKCRKCRSRGLAQAAPGRAGSGEPAVGCCRSPATRRAPRRFRHRRPARTAEPARRRRQRRRADLMGTTLTPAHRLTCPAAATATEWPRPAGWRPRSRVAASGPSHRLTAFSPLSALSAAGWLGARAGPYRGDRGRLPAARCRLSPAPCLGRYRVRPVPGIPGSVAPAKGAK